MKDLSKEVTAELTSKLNRNKDVQKRFYGSFGLDPDLLNDDLDRRRWNIRNIFPDTPVKLLKEVFEVLQLYDFAEFLERATKRRTLRPALSLNEMEKLSNVSNRPTKVYSKAKVLIVGFCEACHTSADNAVETAESFFRAQNSRNEVTTLTTDSLKELLADLDNLVRRKREEESADRGARRREKELKKLLENKISDSWNEWKKRRREIESVEAAFYDDEYDWREEAEIIRRVTKTGEQQLGVFYKEEPAMRNELKELTEKIELWKNETKPLIEKLIKQKEEELKKETEKFEGAVISVIDKWIELRPHDKG